MRFWPYVHPTETDVIEDFSAYHKQFSITQKHPLKINVVMFVGFVVGYIPMMKIVGQLESEMYGRLFYLSSIACFFLFWFIASKIPSRVRRVQLEVRSNAILVQNQAIDLTTESVYLEGNNTKGQFNLMVRPHGLPHQPGRRVLKRLVLNPAEG